MNKNSKLLLRTASIFGVAGAILGTHMAGAGSYSFLPVHAHILVIGWLSLFVWSIFYKVFPVRDSILVKTHVYSAIAGSTLLSVGMWLFMTKPFQINEGLSMIFYIIGGLITLISFILFMVIAFTVKEK